jgi:hypothetical protein
MDDDNHMRFDAKFYVFMKVNKLLDKFIPTGYQLTTEQADAVHEFARKTAKDLLSGSYE